MAEIRQVSSPAGSYGSNQVATYVVRVGGRVDERWAEWLDGMTLAAGEDGGQMETTTLVGTVADQAALLGLLNTLYTLGFPLLDPYWQLTPCTSCCFIQ